MIMTRELTTEEKIVAALRRIIRAVDLHSKYLTHRYGLTGPQIVILQEVLRSRSISTGDLAENVNLSQATVSDILDRLEKRDLVKRTRSSADKRRVLNEVTAKAEEILKEAPPLLQDRFVHSLSQLNDWEQTHILSTLQRVARMMQAEEIEAAPVLVSGPLAVSAREAAEFFSKEEGAKD